MQLIFNQIETKKKIYAQDTYMTFAKSILHLPIFQSVKNSERKRTTLKIENIYVFDFSDIGNACYILNKIPYNQEREKVDIDTLKPWVHILKLSHTSGWQRKFDEKLYQQSASLCLRY